MNQWNCFWLAYGLCRYWAPFGAGYLREAAGGRLSGGSEEGWGARMTNGAWQARRHRSRATPLPPQPRHRSRGTHAAPPTGVAE